MGLDISHDAFSGAYSSFNRFRRYICNALAIAYGDPDVSWPPHKNPDLHPSSFYSPDKLNTEHPGLYELLSHSDCDGEISPGMAAVLADDLEWLLPTIEAMEVVELGVVKQGGHIQRGGWLEAVVKTFIAGARAAAKANEPLEFY